METVLWLGVALAAVLAAVLPEAGLPEGYHAFADQRTLGHVPHAFNVWSNLPFALAGLGLFWQLAQLWRLRASGPCERAGALPVMRGMALQGLLALMALGLLLTALCSSAYHWHPHDAGLCLDRAGMAFAFAGVLGLAVADCVRIRAGLLLAGLLMLAAPWAAWWAWQAGNMAPWAVLQGAGLLLLVALGFRPGLALLGVRWGWVVLAYGVAKALEVGDHAVWVLTGGAVSGHSLKHVVAAMAVIPVLVAVQRQLEQTRALALAAHPESRAASGQNLPMPRHNRAPQA